jgi:hypothetical protein
MMKNRRQFLKALSLTGTALAHPSFVLAANSLSFTGKLVVTVQATGGWDVTHFCDPKENQSGSDIISNWSKTDETRTAGNLSYAPVANNNSFFDRHYDKTLIINGVDAQTNAHSIGETANWSGRTAAGFPTLTALYSAVYAPQLPMSYLSFGGFSKTANLLRPTMLPYSTSDLRGFLQPNIEENNGGFILDTDIWTLIKQLNASDAQRMLEDETLVAGNRSARSAYLESLTNNEALAEFATTLPNREEEQAISGDNNLISQAHFALLAFKSGVSATADLRTGGNFDSHDDNDSEQTDSLRQLTDGLDYLWDYAEQLGLADRLIVIVGSDFSRTPYYNSGAGKDHWPIGSYMVMEKNAAFTNRVIGATDEEQNALGLDTRTFSTSSFSGTKLVPAHVQKALRKHLGLETSATTLEFPLINTELVDFFS